MLNAVTRPTALAVLLTAILAAASALSPLLAQSGSAGGSIGNDEKSLSGSRSDRSAEPAPPARRSKPAAEEPRSSSRRSGGGGGGGGGFDGAWVVTSVGCGGSTSGAVVVSSGKVIGQGVSGTVSASGSVRTFGHGDGGVTFTGAGRLGGRSGSGTWRRSDGCGGTWTSAKQ
ncbi:hypothetical protein [uncultured Bradyrhizobium sp.]|jgi:hypothetical protein|uniref:hypothetical protein n=1 Tax=uncultured Bradyrhizobium sp. TaxID=199684 RepID=UPI00263899C6|nr:hypothetical protein [uncultured Bradyrhizobium sp.]